MSAAPLPALPACPLAHTDTRALKRPLLYAVPGPGPDKHVVLSARVGKEAPDL